MVPNFLNGFELLEPFELMVLQKPPGILSSPSVIQDLTARKHGVNRQA
jgi:hypothetical protein